MSPPPISQPPLISISNWTIVVQWARQDLSQIDTRRSLPFPHSLSALTRRRWLDTRLRSRLTGADGIAATDHLQETSWIDDTLPNLLWENLCRPESETFVNRFDGHALPGDLVRGAAVTRSIKGDPLLAKIIHKNATSIPST
ncbi:uncharacterized protein PGTG_20546 [Puccinia graminis f. sp. tritici CRL 75-36-700-3]|uniref:Uncharacterized protein n=1 Tax=Puccinia graminis f. sp. tritici (strain CRL 75-36-700-3 / race SCCL) TaxID=418459 RepID=E3NYE1_PUCGT|nr:uncharacterized protein PGTG_20546 [Puccinia graminis f. sp. tritici CRL 75-36-700-3]EFP94590.2 hypothetical protein PGTG_20546 [Puccinia graminis f. sp. tritici CRL 75-36-700-3]